MDTTFLTVLKTIEREKKRRREMMARKKRGDLSLRELSQPKVCPYCGRPMGIH